MEKRNTFWRRLNWRMYLPADEREQELYSKAYRLSYRFLFSLLLVLMIVWQFAQEIILNDTHLLTVTIGWIVLAALLSEWIGGRVFIGEDISFSHRQNARWYDKDERVGVAIAILFGLFCVFGIIVYFFVTVPTI